MTPQITITRVRNGYILHVGYGNHEEDFTQVVQTYSDLCEVFAKWVDKIVWREDASIQKEQNHEKT